MMPATTSTAPITRANTCAGVLPCIGPPQSGFALRSWGWVLLDHVFLAATGHERIRDGNVAALEYPHAVHENDGSTEVAAGGQQQFGDDAKDECGRLDVVVLVTVELGDPGGGE